MRFINYIRRKCLRKEEEVYSPNNLQRFMEDLKSQIQYTVISNGSIYEQDLVLFVCKLGEDAFPLTFSLITDNMNNAIKGLIVIYPLEIEGVNLVKLALDGIIHAHSSFDFIIAIDTERLRHKYPLASLRTLFSYTESLATECTFHLLRLNKVTSIESTLKRNWRNDLCEKSLPRLDFEQLLQLGVLTIFQTSKNFCFNKNGLLVGVGRTGGEIVEKIYLLQKSIFISKYSILRLGLGLSHNEGISPYLDLLGIGGNCGVGFDSRPQFCKEIVASNSRIIQKCFNKMLIGTKLPQSTLTKDIIPYIAYNGH